MLLIYIYVDVEGILKIDVKEVPFSCKSYPDNKNLVGLLLAAPLNECLAEKY